MIYAGARRMRQTTLVFFSPMCYSQHQPAPVTAACTPSQASSTSCMLTMKNVQTQGRKKDLHAPAKFQSAKPKAIKNAIKSAIKLSCKKEPCKRKIVDSVKSAEHSLPKHAKEPSKSAKSERKSTAKKSN